MELTKVNSSNIDSIGFENDELFVKFKNNNIYKYDKVPKELYEKFLTAESPGRFLKEHVLNKYAYTKLGTQPLREVL